MSRKSYNNHGVPWYCRPDLPAVRSTPPAEPAEITPEQRFSLNLRAQKQRQEIFAWLKAFWKPGDLFVMTLNGWVPTPEDNAEHRAAAKRHYCFLGSVGVYTGYKLRGGNTYYVYPEWLHVDWPPENGQRCMTIETFHAYAARLVECRPIDGTGPWRMWDAARPDGVRIAVPGPDQDYSVEIYEAFEKVWGRWFKFAYFDEEAYRAREDG